MRTHKISVTVDHNAIRVDPDTLTMTPLDEVHWAGMTARKFSIVFDGNGPFASRELAHAVAHGKHRPRAKGRYKYTVVSEENPSLKLDPVIIVDEPPTGTSE
jgi:plastocyanin